MNELLTDEQLDELRLTPIHVVPREEEIKQRFSGLLSDNDIDELCRCPANTRFEDVEAKWDEVHTIKKRVETMKYVIQGLKKVNGNLTPSYSDIFNILFLADREHLRDIHLFIVPRDRYVVDRYAERGYRVVPVLCDVIIKVARDKIRTSYYNLVEKEFEFSPCNGVSCLKEIDYAYLAQSNIEYLDKTIKEYGKCTATKLDMIVQVILSNSATGFELTMFDIARGIDKLEGGDLEKELREKYNEEDLINEFIGGISSKRGR